MNVAPKITLNNGIQMPAIGLGTYSVAPEEMVNIIKSAIDVGYRHFDCALLYRNEKYVGQAIREKISEGLVKREDIFVVSKLWNTYHRPDLVIKGCKETLKNLGLDYVDLYLIHWPMPFKAVNEIKVDKEISHETSILDCPQYFPFDEDKKIIPDYVDIVDTWKAMEECVDLKLTKSIGISNFNSEQVEKILKNARIRPVTNQIEVNPYFNQKKLIDFCTERDIWVTAYGPLGLQIPNSDPGFPRLVDNPKIVEIAQKRSKTPAQVILRFLIQRKTIPIPKTSKVSRLPENLSVFDFSLSDEEMAVMDSLNRNKRLCVIPGTESHKNFPFAIEF